MSDLMTIKETAEYLRLHPKTLEVKRANGTGPAFVRVGRKIFYRRPALDSWIAAHTHSEAA